MQPNDNPFATYSNGLEMWCNNVSSYGVDEAIIISRNYLERNLKRDHSDEELQFCREMFVAMFDATAGKIYPSKLVYPYDLNTADGRKEADYYYANRRLNTECACGIDRIINDSCYKTNFYNLEIAAMNAIHDYGFHRVCLVLAFNYQQRSREGRFSAINQQWTNAFIVQEEVFNNAWLQVHAILVDSFCRYVRELYEKMDVERFLLPGNEECSELVGSVEIKRAIITSDDGNGFVTGYAIGFNPEAVSPWVCWQFAVRDGKRHYNWGIYCNEKQAAIDAYNARVFVALNK